MGSGELSTGTLPPRDGFVDVQNHNPAKVLYTTESLEALQTDEQRHVLDIVAQLRKCGLESVLSLPQLVVCGDQSAGKSSVLEALTEIPFPRNDNLCTRFATEIILRRATTDMLTIKVIPDSERPPHEQDQIKCFGETITDFDELPVVMERATALIGIDKAADSRIGARRAFAKDTLSVVIQGPQRPQLTLVDLPGIIQSETKDASKEDVSLVSAITEHYISQSRTICLAVVSATNDYANQPILNKVRRFDPKGDRTLGIITKPDRLPPGSGTEKAFLQLAKNEDIFFKLGWHVLKNRSFEESSYSFLERNASEADYFRRSIFSNLSSESIGIHSLTSRLSRLLFAHVQQELPKLQEDLETALTDARRVLADMGIPRAGPQDCRAYLTQLSLGYYEVCKAAVGGHYEGDYFNSNHDQDFSPQLPASVRRLRAVVQIMNQRFSENHRKNGHKFRIEWFANQTKVKGDEGESEVEVEEEGEEEDYESDGGSDFEDGPSITTPSSSSADSPKPMTNKEALDWVGKVILRTRGRELAGNFNPLVIGELFWEQSSKWQNFATAHINQVADICRQFLSDLLKEKSAKDVYARLWSQIQNSLKSRHKAAVDELDRIMEDVKSYPINYNSYYTDIIRKRGRMRERDDLAECIKTATQHIHLEGCRANHTSASIDVDRVMELFLQRTDPDMGKHSCEEVLDCLYATYKVNEKVFVANVTTQVIERHIVRGLESILSPVVVNKMSDSEVQALASEPRSAKSLREFVSDRVGKLEEGHSILQDVMKVV